MVLVVDCWVLFVLILLVLGSLLWLLDLLVFFICFVVRLVLGLFGGLVCCFFGVARWVIVYFGWSDAVGSLRVVWFCVVLFGVLVLCGWLGFAVRLVVLVFWVGVVSVGYWV